MKLLLAAAALAAPLVSPALPIQRVDDPAATKPPVRGQALLDDLSRRAVRYFVQESHPVTGFTKDRAANLAPSDTFDVSSIAAVGFALSAYAIGTERKWLSRPDALERARRTARQVYDRWPHHRGWYAHFVHWGTGERMWQSEYSTIDTSIFLCGLLMAERYFRDPELTAATDQIFARIDWAAMLTDGGAKPGSLTFTHGWRPETGYLNSRWAVYSEELMLLILGLGSWAEMPTGTWAALERPVVQYAGFSHLRGGPLFIHHMSHVFIDFRNRRDAFGFDYWVSSRNATLAQIRYAIDNPRGWQGYSADTWGISACDSPDGYSAFGFLGFGEDLGTLAPMGAVTSAFLTPAESRRAAEAFRARHPNLWGRYGFSVSHNPSRNWTSPDVIGIDLGMMLLGIENARDRLPQRMVMSHPIIGRGMIRAGLRVTSEGASENRPLRR